MANSPMIYGQGGAKMIKPVIYDSDGFIRSVDRRHGFMLHEDFLTGTIGGSNEWGQSGTGSDAPNQASNSGEEASGIVYIGATNAGTHRASFLAINTIPVNRGITHIEFYTRLSVLSTSSHESRIFWGMIDNLGVASGAPTDGFWFEYDRANNGDFFSVSTAAASSITKYVADGGGGRSTFAVTAGVNTFKRFTIIADPQNDTAKFYIDGSLVTEITTNLPKTEGQNSSAGWTVQKIVGNGTSQLAYMDYIRYGMVYNTPRP